MLTTGTSVFAPADGAVHDNYYLCYRCEKCNRLITKLEMLEWRAADGGRGRPSVCPCGSGRISATNPTDDDLERLCTPWRLVLTLLGRKSPKTRLWRLRCAVYASPPHEDWKQCLFSLVWFGPRILPPPPPPTEEEIRFAEEAKLAIAAMEDRVKSVMEKLKAEDLPLEEALVRTSDEEAGR